MMPRSPAAYLEMDKGIVISAQHTPNISNKLQKQVESHVVKMFPNDDGVFYHKQMAGGKHIWMVHALNEEVQEMVAGALAGVKLSLVEIGVFQAADELQRLQKGMSTVKQAMRKIVESESSSQTRRATGKLLYSKKTEEVNEKADVALLAARGLSSWHVMGRCG
jgi:hypothetical protein